MSPRAKAAVLNSPEAVDAALAAQRYISDIDLRTTLYLALTLSRPLLIEGPAGVGKTEVAKALAAALDTRLIRLQCYEGLDASAALYDWDYPRQLMELRIQEAAGASAESLRGTLYSDDFLLERPLLAALRARKPPVLLIDEIDRADEAFESFLLEILSENQISIPEYGTVKAAQPPIVILTGNRTRALADATRRRCLYLWIDYPDRAKERAVLAARLPEIDSTLADRIADFLAGLRGDKLAKTPGLSETLDWARALVAVGATDLVAEQIPSTLGALLKDPDDLARVRARLTGLDKPRDKSQTTGPR